MTKVLVTGHTSMIGRQVVNQLKGKSYDVVGERVDLTSSIECDSLFEKYSPEYVIHCAGYNGGIEFNREHPSEIFYKTAMMALNVLNACEFYGVTKVVSILPSCSYPAKDGLLNELEFGCGNSHPTVECHGHAKRILFDYGKQIFKQTNGKTTPVCVVSNNSFGPYDSYDINKTKFVGGAIKKLAIAEKFNHKEVVFWGDGSPLREFVYCKDVANGIVQTLEKYNNPFDVINIGGVEVSIKYMVTMIAAKIGYSGEIIWNTSRPNGQMRKALDKQKMNEILDIQFTPLNKALDETIDWFYENCNITE